MTAPTPADLNDRARGWLRFVWEKATTPDDWSSSGEPLPWWDRDSTAPMCSFPRFDLGETAYALPLYAEATPAWREIYTRIGRELCDRHTTFWAASDWITLIGEDPNLDRYPPEWQVFIPERLRGSYASPGWTGNGKEPWGLQPDPIAADGNFFFRGFFNLLLSVYAYVSGDDHYEQPFEITGYQDRRFAWTQREIAEYISAQLAARPEGPHCENTKIWPFCVSAGGLGLKLYDAVNGTSLQRPYDAWVDFARAHYMGLDKRGELEWFALYYDPFERQMCNFANDLAGYGGLCITPYVTPQNPEFGARLYELSLHKLGWNTQGSRINQFLPDPRFIGIALLMAHELGDATTADRLRAYADREFEPRFFGEDDSRFGYFFGYGEDYPRGQQSALMIMPELGGRGSWTRVFDRPDRARLHEPTVEGIDYPSLGVAAARNDHATGELRVRTYAATPAHTGRPTTWRVTQLPDAAAVRVTCDGQDFSGWRVTAADTIELALDIGDHDIRILTGYQPGAHRATRAQTASPAPARGAGAPSRSRPVTTTIRAPSAAAITAVSSCRCC